MKPESYPFLRIAKQHGVDYGVVLRVAHEVRLHGGGVWLYADFAVDFDVYNAITKASNAQEDIREGLVDWLTGEEK